MRTQKSRGIALLLLLCGLVRAGAAQTQPMLQLFLPGGRLPGRELKVTFLPASGERASAKSDVRGAVRIPQEATRSGTITLQIEGDNVDFATTNLNIRLEDGASPLPIFLMPPENATFIPAPNAQDIDGLDLKVPPLARAAREDAVRAVKEKNWAKATAALAEAITIHPQYLRAINEYGMLQYQRGRLDEAAAAFIQAASLRAKFPAARLNLAMTRLRQDRRGDAGIVLQSLLVVFPDFSSARIQYANLLFRGQQLDEAAEQYRRLAADATLPPTDRADAHTKLGIIRQREERYNGALREYQQALELGQHWPGEPQTRIFLGNVLQELKRYDEAEREYLKALELGGARAAVVHQHLGQIYAEQKKYDQAIKAYESLLQSPLEPQEILRVKAEIERLKTVKAKSE